MAVSAKTPAVESSTINETSIWGRRAIKVLIYALLIGFALIEFLPFLWALSASLKGQAEIQGSLSFPPKFIPDNPTLQNYGDIFSIVPFGTWYLNSFFVAIVTTLLTLFFASTSGYAFARIPFPGRDIVFWMIVGTMAIPSVITIIPTYILLKTLGLTDTLQGLIIPFMVTAFGIFLMRQFFVSIPGELEEAARVDGAGRIRIFWQIVLPLARPALSALTIFTFMGRWNDFLMPLIIIGKSDLFTLPLGMSTFRGQYKTDWNLLMSGSILVMIPIVVLYVAFQRFFIEGIATTGLKG
jgi:multiple sugar transport system permease protein